MQQYVNDTIDEKLGGNNLEEKINEQIDAIADQVDDKIAQALDNFDGG